MMTCCMAMGQAAGLAAAMALEKSVPPADVDVSLLRHELLRRNAILNIPD